MKQLTVGWHYPTMDDWQKEILTFFGYLILMCGRQVGKSEIMAKKLAEWLLNNPSKKVLIVSGVERQASGLYNKVLAYIEQYHPYTLKRGDERPLRTVFQLENGSSLITEPIGLDGAGARQHTLHGVVFEEMQLIPEEAFSAITPMLLTTGGWIWMLGTAWATEGYVYERLSDPEFRVWRINSEEVAEKRPEPQRTIMLEHLARERKRLSEAEYAQEYLAIPSDKIRQVFPDALIKKAMSVTRPGYISGKTHILGADPAGMGEDEGSISIFDYDEDIEMMTQVEHEVTSKLYTTQTTERILIHERNYGFEKIYVDDGGLGFGVFSELLAADNTKYKVVPINNSRRALDYKDEERTKTMEEEIIVNLLMLMERGKIALLQDNDIRESLKSYKFEYKGETKRLIISSNYNHPVQSIARAAWYSQSKGLKLSVHSIKV